MYIQLIKAIKQDDFNYHYTPLPILYFIHVSDGIVVQQLKGNIFLHVSATKGVLQLAGPERLKSFTNSYCDNGGKTKEKKKPVNSESIFFSHVVSSLRILSTYT